MDLLNTGLGYVRMEKTAVSGGVLSASVIQRTYISLKVRRALISLQELSLRLEETAEGPTSYPTQPVYAGEGEGQGQGQQTSGHRSPMFESLDPNVVIILVVLLLALISAAFLNSIMRCVMRRSGTRQGPHTESQTVQGLDAKALNVIPVHSYRAAQFEKLTDGTPVECSICLNDFVENEQVRLLPRCNHVFHIHCIDTWLLSHVSCPVCRDGVMDDPKSQSSTIIAVEEPPSSSVNSHTGQNTGPRTELSQESGSTSSSGGDGSSSIVVHSALVGGSSSDGSRGAAAPSRRRRFGVRVSLSSMFARENIRILVNLRRAPASSSSSASTSSHA
ncbi:hypothetical protein R1sor_002092 [Riccia sorocarpa]|uniref:RING-type E3 ubiquitin transferase n=1 Tax=Riccia sorocarpa TaxID=122646 RepID=A0ABD3H160_9MARC